MDFCPRFGKKLTPYDYTLKRAFPGGALSEAAAAGAQAAEGSVEGGGSGGNSSRGRGGGAGR